MAPNSKRGDPVNTLAIAMSARPDAKKDHFYPTPPAGTRALLAVERFDGPIWEPACGEGHMSRELEAAGYEVISTDLVDRGYGTSRVDFLMESRPLAPNIMTNPPFKLGEKFARHALGLTTGKVALLCRLMWLEGRERRRMFEDSPLARVWVFSRRLGMRANTVADKGGMVPYAWFVFEHGHKGPPALGWVDPA